MRELRHREVRELATVAQTVSRGADIWIKERSVRVWNRISASTVFC